MKSSLSPRLSRCAEKSTKRLNGVRSYTHNMREYVCLCVQFCTVVVTLLFYLLHSNLLFAWHRRSLPFYETPDYNRLFKPLSITMEYVYQFKSTYIRMHTLFNGLHPAAILFNSNLFYQNVIIFICNFLTDTLSHTHSYTSVRICISVYVNRFFGFYDISDTEKNTCQIPFLILSFDFSPFIMHMHFYSAVDFNSLFTSVYSIVVSCVSYFGSIGLSPCVCLCFSFCSPIFLSTSLAIRTFSAFHIRIQFHHLIALFERSFSFCYAFTLLLMQVIFFAILYCYSFCCCCCHFVFAHAEKILFSYGFFNIIFQ